MKTCLILIFAFLLSAVPVAAQKTARIFDNFDRSQGVPIYREPEPEPVAVTTKKRVKRNGKWVVITEDKLVKKTVSSAPSVRVTDGVSRSSEYISFGKLKMGTGNSLKGFTTGVPAHDKFIEDAARKYHIDPLLIYAQMHQESSFKVRATSNKGASGLMQLMPATARRFGVTKIYDPKQNIEAGVRYMRWLLDTFDGDVVLALAGYNAGEGAVMKYRNNVPPYRETREYVRRITTRYNTISNPQYVQRIASARTAQTKNDERTPLNLLEADPLTVRLPGGKMMLVNQ
jgi:hypothetical protein